MQNLKEIIRENAIWLPFLGTCLATGFAVMPMIPPGNYNPNSINPQEIRFEIEDENTFLKYKGIEYLLQKVPDSEEIIFEKHSTYESSKAWEKFARRLSPEG